MKKTIDFKKLKIEKNVSMNDHPAYKYLEFFRKMRVGDSVGNLNKNQIDLLTKGAKLHGYKIASKKELGGTYRIWMVRKRTSKKAKGDLKQYNAQMDF